MSERQRSGHEEDEVEPSPAVKEAAEKLEAMDVFLARLREMTEALRTKTRAERPRGAREGETFDGIATERLQEQRREDQGKRAESVWKRFREEGINPNTLREFSDNVMSFSAAELQSIIATIDDLIREWDPATHWFLQNLKRQLQAMARLKEAEQE